MYRVLLSITFLLSLSPALHAQEINFSDYANYSLTVGELNSNDLNFGQVVTGNGIYSIGINNGKIITITGVEYLDVIVEVTAENSLYLNGNPANAGDPQKSVPFTLQAAYANNKGLPSIGQAKFINVVNNSFIKRIPILERQAQPPGPPPPPPTNAFEQSQVEETAYLYLYGSINVGEVNAGYYSGTITVTINYN
ncbi:MAG TPA: hypothetical protein VF181_12840 [Balneolaceae bacterium]